VLPEVRDPARLHEARRSIELDMVRRLERREHKHSYTSHQRIACQLKEQFAHESLCTASPFSERPCSPANTGGRCLHHVIAANAARPG
jgi:hypothetical protein